MQKYFVKFIFGRRHQGGVGIGGIQALKASNAAANEGSNVYEAQSYISDSQVDSDFPDSAAYQQIARMHQPVKVIHKEHDAITSFCINKVEVGSVTIETIWSLFPIKILYS